MREPARPPSFAVISGKQIHGILHGREKRVIDLVAEGYELHAAGAATNPPSYFLRFPDRPSSRIIALPASVGGAAPADGLKWISSFPENVSRGIPRASAVIVLNDPDTGYPLACMEASIISACRTAASAALAADRLTAGRQRPARIGFVGAGIIARYVHTYLAGSGWTFAEAGVYDLLDEHAAGFRSYLDGASDGTRTWVASGPEELIRGSDLVVFATVSGTPHIHDPAWFDHNPVVLHLSLRDLAPEVILASTNVVDDVDHCLRAGTSLHLTEDAVGHRDFVQGTIADVLAGRLSPATDRPLVFSPFGLGVLDLVVAKSVYDDILAAGELATVDDFFYELRRYG